MVEVTQADRDAAAAVHYNYQKGSLAWPHAKSGKDRIKSGEWDNHSLIQAFAAHHLAAIAEGRRQMREEAATATVDCMCDQEWPPQDGDVQIDEVVAAIRAIPIGDE